MAGIRVLRLVICLLILLALPALVHAQTGGWLSANATWMQPATTTLTQTSSTPYRGETYSDKTTFNSAGEPSFDIGGGVTLFNRLGIGIAISRYSHSEKGTVWFSVPHPLVYNRPATASGPTTSDLEHRELAVHIEARFVANTPRVAFAVFAGPTYFQGSQGIVTDYAYSQLLLSDLSYTVELKSTQSRQADVSAWGFNVGFDFGYFFGERAGVGAIVRYSRAKADLPNELLSTATTDSFNLGGLSAGGGLRIRF